MSGTHTALRELRSRIRGRVDLDVPLADFTTYRIGGPAKVLIQPADAGDVSAALRFAAESDTPWLALGLGSNLLVSDTGFDGIVVRLGKGLDRIESQDRADPHSWRVGAALPTPILARRTAKAGLAGVHRLIGVPGTVGGGVFMNAGAHGQDFSQVVRSVEVVGETGQQRVMRGAEIPWRYRSSGLDRTIVLAATVALESGDPAQLEKEIRAHFKWRKEGTPFNEPCCGSVFRNPAPSSPRRPARVGGAAAGGEPPPAPTAGKLIDACGLKGFTIGGAQVSPTHANYIVNTGAATAADVLAVIAAVRERVAHEHGVDLELEVKLVGEGL